MSTLNEIGEQALDAIRRNLKSWDQGWYVAEASLRERHGDQPDGCGTTFCFAGHVLAVAGYTTKIHKGILMWDLDEREYEFALAQALLGWSRAQAEEIFYATQYGNEALLAGRFASREEMFAGFEAQVRRVAAWYAWLGPSDD